MRIKYRKIALIEAERFFEAIRIPEGVNLIGNDCGYYIDTKQGRQTVNEGDYIITNPDGEKYPCNPKTFEETYEEVSITNQDKE